MPQQEFGSPAHDAQALDEQSLEALRAELALMQGERERALSSRALTVSYHTVAARARNCASLARYCIDALESAWGGACVGVWVWIEPGVALESGFVFGDGPSELAIERFAQAKRERKTYLTHDETGRNLCIVPIFGLSPASSVIGIIALEATDIESFGAHRLGTGDVIGLLAGMHIDRLARIDAQRLEVKFAAAAAKAQRLLAEPRERPDALWIVVTALGEARLDVAAVIGPPGDSELVGFAGERVPEEALFEAGRAVEGGSISWIDGGYLVLPIGTDAQSRGFVIVRNPAPIGMLNEDIMGGIASAVNASVARFEIAQELEELRRNNTRQLIDAQERERAIVAGEIHDGVIQQLSAVAMRLELGLLHSERGDDRSALDMVRAEVAEVRDSTRELRKLLVDLRPQVIDDHGLEPALLELTSRLEGATAELHFKLSADPQGDVSIAVYRLVQEALTNVQKHARADNVIVTVGEEGDRMVITIEDDGIGMVVAAPGPTATGRHYGVLSMRERARMLGGDFSIGARDEKGTVVRATLPLA